MIHNRLQENEDWTTHLLDVEALNKKAAEGNFDLAAAEKEWWKTFGKISLDMSQTAFQTEVGRLEVLGELIIKHK
jgi:hypothetical protein